MVGECRECQGDAEVQQQGYRGERDCSSASRSLLGQLEHGYILLKVRTAVFCSSRVSLCKQKFLTAKYNYGWCHVSRSILQTSLEK